MSNVIDAVFKLTDNFSQPLSKCMDSLTEASKMGTRTRKTITKIGKSIEDVGGKLTTAVTLPIAGVATAALKTSIDFESGMAKVKAISGATGDDFKALKQQALDLGTTTIYSASEVADAMTEVSKSGWGFEQISQGMEGVLGAAAASGEDVSEVATIISNALNTFQLSADQSERVADVLTEAANAGTIDIADLGESFGYVGTTAQQMGFSIEEVASALTLLSAHSITGSRAGTGLRRVLNNLTNPTAKMQKVIDELNIDITDGEGHFKSLTDIVGDLQGAFSGLDQVTAKQYAKILGGEAGQEVLTSFAQSTPEEFATIADAMNDCSGEATTTASVMTDTVSGSIKELTGSLTALAVELTEELLPHLSKVVDKAKEMVDAFRSMDDATQGTVLKWVAFAAALGPVLSILGKVMQFSMTIADLVAKFSTIGQAGAAASGAAASAGAGAGGIGAALSTVATTVLPVIAIIGVAIAAIISHIEEFKASIAAVADNCSGVFDRVGVAFSGLVSAVSTQIELFKALIWAVGEILAKTFDGLVNNDFFTLFVTGLADIIAGVIEIFTGLINWLTGIFTGDLELAMDGAKQVFQGLYDFVAGICEGILGFLGSIGEGIGGIAEGVGTVAGKAASWIADKVAGNASGDPHWSGGLTHVNEQGGEIMNLPNGTQIIPHDLSRNMIGNSGSTVTITGNTFTVREQADIDRITDALVRKMYRAQANMGTA